MNKSENINELASALAKAQSAIESAPKDSENPFFKSHYAGLASVWSVARKPLSDNGLAVTQHPSADGNIVTVETVLCHLSGQWLASQLTMLAKDASPQAIGSCITYARRYALSSVLGIASEDDDDGNSAQPAKGNRPAASHDVLPLPGGPTAVQPKTKKAPLAMATSGTRAAALDRLGCQEDGPAKLTLHKYLVALGWLDADKAVEQWPVRFIPISPGELSNLQASLSKFEVTGIAERPYQPHGVDPGRLQPRPVAPPAAPAEPDWCKFVMPFGTAGTKGKKLGELKPEELEFYVKEFAVRETVEIQAADGSIVKHAIPSASIAQQRAFRAALDQSKLQAKG